MSAEKTIAIIGTGRLGSAMARGFARSGREMLLVNRSPEKASALAQELPVARIVSLEEAVLAADILIIAVKPAGVAETCAAIAKALPTATKTPLVVSVAVGARLSDISALLPAEALVARAMPTIAAAVGEGIIGIVGSSQAAQQAAAEVFSSIGSILLLENETAFDAVLAMSASGLGFVAYLAEGFVAGGEKMGLTLEQARRCVAEVLIGAGTLLRDTAKSPEDLRNQVATPAGTTMAGLAELEKAAVREALINAIEAAVRRAEELRSS